MNILYWYPGCSTCKAAARWLRDNGVVFETVDIVRETPDVATLRDLWQKSGLPVKRFFNTSGNSYRAGGWSEKLKSTGDEQALEALAADGMLIKRPILTVSGRVFVGFREKRYDL